MLKEQTILIPNEKVNQALLKLFIRDVVTHSINKFGVKYEGPCSITTVRKGKRWLIEYFNGQIKVFQYVNSNEKNLKNVNAC